MRFVKIAHEIPSSCTYRHITEVGEYIRPLWLPTKLTSNNVLVRRRASASVSLFLSSKLAFTTRWGDTTPKTKLLDGIPNQQNDIYARGEICCSRGWMDARRVQRWESEPVGMLGGGFEPRSTWTDLVWRFSHFSVKLYRLELSST
jgi:hypothetical protein